MKKTQSIIMYSSPDGILKLEVPIDGETVWLSQKQMAELFGCTSENIIIHLKNIYDSGELTEKATTKESLVVQKEGNRSVKRDIQIYNLDAIISLGYRVNSIRGTQFRMWATNKLKEYIVKGFVLDDERLADGKKSGYFDELLERIRAIRASERNFYQKITDIYATSVDYNKDVETTKMFFATVQNKIHFAVHGHTAAEIVATRADAQKKYMGLTNFKGKMVLEKDVSIAKNYLSEEELKQLNLIVTLYLDFAELQASNRRAMTMKEWVSKLDDFLKLSEKQIFSGSGKVSKEKAEEKARKEYEKYRKAEDVVYISDFDKQTRKYLGGKKRDQ
ncbi:MAG: virulence RhuM family protein [Candidatus Taylorbacteria bacterium]